MKPAIRNPLLAGALLIAPAILYAATGDYVDVPGQGWFGSNHFGAQNGTLAVGDTSNMAPPVGTSITGAAAIGTGLRACYPNCVVAGQYSMEAAPGGAPLFILGNGGNVNTRGNALEVGLDGAAFIRKVPARGGISMGEFGYPPSS